MLRLLSPLVIRGIVDAVTPYDCLLIPALLENMVHYVNLLSGRFEGLVSRWRTASVAMYSTSTSPYADRSQDKSYKRPNFAHSQSALNFSALGASNTSQQPLAASQQLPPTWSTSFNPQPSLAASTRDASGYLPGYLLSASQGMVCFYATQVNALLTFCYSPCQRVLNDTKTLLYCHQKIRLMAVLLLALLALRMEINICKFIYSLQGLNSYNV